MRPAREGPLVTWARVKRKNEALAHLAAYGPRRRRVWPWVSTAVVVLALAAGGTWYASSRTGSPTSGAGTTTTGAATAGASVTQPFAVAGVSPASGTTGVASDTTISVHFTAPLPDAVSTGSVIPTLAPAVAGSWHRSHRDVLQFVPSAPFIPGSTETLSIPGGPGGMQDAAGQSLGSTDTVTFAIAHGSEERLQQLLALTGYLPLSFAPSGPAPSPAQAAMPQSGGFSWRWAGLPPSLTSLWTEGSSSPITKGAVMALEDQNGMSVDAVAGPQVWTVLLGDVAKGTKDQAPYSYVDVSKTVPQSLTVWVDGTAKFANVPVNTGAPGADTTDGVYEVFEHVTSSEMKGTNADGSTYDDPNVPWASYFNGGDALHGFVRATYGSPQSNGCVEMAISDAAATWPYTPIGTLVNVEGPPVT